MSTSLLYHAFRVRDYSYVRTKYIAGGVVFTIERKPKTYRCVACGSLDVGRQGIVTRTFRTLPIGNSPVELEVRIPRLACRKCKVVRQAAIGFAEPRRTYTKAFARYVLDLSRNMTIKAVAQHLGVSWDVVKEIQKKDLQKRFAKPRLKHAKIEAVAIDMSPAYIEAVIQHLPEATLVFDRFHVIKLYNHGLSNLRRDLYRQLSDTMQKDVLKGVRWLLLKRPENLDASRREPQRLRQALRLNEPLAMAYCLKEELNEIWEQDDRETAEALLKDWIIYAESSGVRQLHKFARTLRIHARGILDWYDYPISTGPLEGTNNKIKTMKRQAYGFRDPEFLMLKILGIHETTYALVG